MEYMKRRYGGGVVPGDNKNHLPVAQTMKGTSHKDTQLNYTN
jgi:hypothetical protein